MKRTIERAGCEDFNEVLACMGDLERLGRIPRVADGTELSSHIRDAILRNPDLNPQIAVVDQENISIPGLSEHKRPARSIFERVEHQHEHNFEGNPTGETVWFLQPSKPMLNENHKRTRMEFSEWAKQKLEEGDLFIYSDESWHEIGSAPSKKNDEFPFQKAVIHVDMQLLNPVFSLL